MQNETFGKGVGQVLGDNIRKYRKANKLSQKSLAQKLNVTPQIVSLWERGALQPTPGTLDTLSELFHVSMEMLLENENSAENSDMDFIPVAEKPLAGYGKGTSAGEPHNMDFIPVAEKPLAGYGNGKPTDENAEEDRNMDFIPVTEESLKRRKLPVTWTMILTLLAVVLALVAFFVMRAVNAPKQVPESPAHPTVTKTQTVTATETKAETKTTKAEKPDATTKKAKNETGLTVDAEGKNDFYVALANFAIENGQILDTTRSFICSANRYGGHNDRNFSLNYKPSDGELSFGLSVPMNNGRKMDVFLFVPKTGVTYQYAVLYATKRGETVTETDGMIPAETFTENQMLPCSHYIGSASNREKFLVTSRDAVRYLLICARNFLEEEDIEYSLSDIGFKKF